MAGAEEQPHERLARRLEEMRDDALNRMLERGEPEPGLLQLLAGIATATGIADPRSLPPAHK
jgi:hypothetical protein